MNYINTFYIEESILAYFMNDDPGDMLQRELDVANEWWADTYNEIGEFLLDPEGEHYEIALCQVCKLMSRCVKVKLYAMA